MLEKFQAEKMITLESTYQHHMKVNVLRVGGSWGNVQQRLGERFLKTGHVKI